MLSFTRSRLFGSDKIKHGQDPMESMLVIRGVSMTDSEAAAQRMLAPLLQIPHRDKCEVAVEIVPTSMAEEYGAPWSSTLCGADKCSAQQLADNPPGHYFAQNAWLQGDPESVADSLKQAFTTLPSKQSFFLWYAMGPLRPLPENMAFSLQTEHYTAGYIISQGNDVGADSASS